MCTPSRHPLPVHHYTRQTHNPHHLPNYIKALWCAVRPKTEQKSGSGNFAYCEYCNPGVIQSIWLRLNTSRTKCAIDFNMVALIIGHEAFLFALHSSSCAFPSHLTNIRHRLIHKLYMLDRECAGLFLLTWINFNPNMNKWVYPLWHEVWDEITNPFTNFNDGVGCSWSVSTCWPIH